MNAVHLGSPNSFTDVFRSMHSLRSLTFGLYTGSGVSNNLMFYENYSIQHIQIFRGLLPVINTYILEIALA